MSSLTIAQIRAAQTNDLTALSAVIADMEARISRLASQAARRLDGDHREDFAQDAREALFLALPRAEGDDVDRIVGFLYSSMQDALKDKVRAARYVGVDKDAVKVFMSVLEDAEGDPYKAERLAQTLPDKGVRLSADRANAARLAWQGAVSIDKGNDDETASLADTLAAPQDETPQVRPKVGRGAVLEALSVLERHVSVPRDADTREALFKALDAMQTGFVTPDQADTVADCVRVPADPQTRRYVLDAVAILHSAASTADDGDLVEELRDVSDDRRDERAAKISVVAQVLDEMGARGPMQRDALVLSFGIGGVKCYGTGDAGDLDGMAAEMGTTYAKAQLARTKGLKSFAKRFIAKVARTEAEAVALSESASANLSRGGRK
jgi:hypothetical protein